MSLIIDELSDDDTTTLISGSDSTQMLTPNITLVASENSYSLNTSIPSNTWVDLSIRGKGKQTFALIKTAHSEEEERISRENGHQRRTSPLGYCCH
jgi:hexosaminidase